jgi:dihydroneopterin aldolase
MAGMLLNRLTAVQAVRLEVRKPAAVAAAACSFVRLERKRT